MVGRFSKEKYLELQKKYDYFKGFNTSKDDYDNGSFKINDTVDFKNVENCKFPQNDSDIKNGIEVILTNFTTNINIQYSKNSYNKDLQGHDELRTSKNEKVHKGHILAKNLFKYIKYPQGTFRVEKRHNLVYMSEWCNCADNNNCKGQRFFEHIVEDTLNSKEEVEIWYKVKPIYNENVSNYIPVAMHLQGKILNDSTIQFQRNGKTYGQFFNVLIPNMIALKKMNLKD